VQWRNLYRGFFMGICDIVPGVSGGTMALILGIYENFIKAVSGFFSRDWKRHLGFLIPLGAGMMFAIVSLANAMNFLLERYSQETNFLFTGLLVGVLPLLLKNSHGRKSFRPVHLLLLFIMALLALFIGGAAQQDGGTAILELTAQNAWLFFIAGWIASMAMLLPGVSGAFVLLLFGVYQTATNALSVTNPNLPVILLVGSGVIVGFIISSKGIRYLFHHYPSYTYAGIIGLIIGAAFTIFPGFGNGSAAASTFAFAAGTATAYVLSLKQP
jgi:putative membrane protein